jgi:hypothetical protein
MSPAGQSPTMGSTGIPAMPGQGATPPASGGLGPTIGDQSQLPQLGPTPQQRMQGYMDQVRQLHMAIDALAQDHPEASEELNSAKNALANSMGKVASAISSPEGSPTTLTF